MINLRPRYVDPAIIKAIKNRSADDALAMAALQLCANMSDKKGNTALMYALSGGEPFMPIVEKLIRSGANVDAKNDAGITALMLASSHNNAYAVGLLMKGKAAINAQDGEGNTALIYAVKRNNAEVVKMLISNGADPKITNKYGLGVYDYAMRFSYTETIAVLDGQKAQPAPKPGLLRV